MKSRVHKAVHKELGVALQSQDLKLDGVYERVK